MDASSWSKAELPVPEGVKWQLVNSSTQLCLAPSAQGLTEQAIDLPGCCLFDGEVLKQAPALSDSICQQFQLRSAD